MKNIKIKWGSCLLIILCLNACTRKSYDFSQGMSTHSYRNSNKIHKDTAKYYANLIRKPPPALISDSIPSPKKGVRTVNFNLRKPNFVIIHYTAQNYCEATLKTFTSTKSQVSAHYLICKDGTVYQLLNDYMRAWHAGMGSWGHVDDVNSSSIGIEIDNNGTEPFLPEQIKSLEFLLQILKTKYKIPKTNFIGHADVAPGRKVDPGAWFPWQELSEKGFGLWYTDTSKVTVPDSFNIRQALRIIGYRVPDTSAMYRAIRAFNLHYIPNSPSSGSLYLTEGEQKILYSIMEQSLKSF